MQSTQAQITRMQQLIDGGSNREFHQLADVSYHFLFNIQFCFWKPIWNVLYKFDFISLAQKGLWYAEEKCHWPFMNSLSFLLIFIKIFAVNVLWFGHYLTEVCLFDTYLLFLASSYFFIKIFYIFFSRKINI